MVEDLMRRERMPHSFTQVYAWRTATRREADQILERGSEKTAGKGRPTAAPIPMLSGSWKHFWMKKVPPSAESLDTEEKQPNPLSGCCLCL